MGTDSIENFEYIFLAMHLKSLISGKPDMESRKPEILSGGARIAAMRCGLLGRLKINIRYGSLQSGETRGWGAALTPN